MKLYKEAAGPMDDVGLADNDIDGFLKSLLASVTRECAQNSNDEACERPEQPVRMCIDMVELNTADIPDVDAYKSVIDACLAEASKHKRAKAKEFFKNAQRVLAQDKVRLLSIADSRTHGAGGPFSKGGKFFTLVVSKGQTDKLNIFSAGSFGIGKNAALAGSELRLVFYSSVFKEDGAEKFYCMGKSVLTSWRRKDDQNMSHKVFFGEVGEDALRPITDFERAPEWLRKNELGLQVAIVAPRLELRDGWKPGYIASLLSNFFVAIHDRDIEFQLDGGCEIINREMMLNYFSREDVSQAADAAGSGDNLNWAKMCTEAFLENDFISETINVSDLGEFEVLLRVGEGLPKKVLIVRNGMVITDSLRQFGKPLNRFPSLKEFIAVVRPRAVDDESSAMIKRMENPEHNDLTPGYIADEKEVKKLRKAILQLERDIRQVVKKHAKMEVVDNRDIEELKDFFPAGSDDSTGGTSEDNDPTAVVTKKGAKIANRKKAYKKGAQTGGTGKHGGGTKKKGGKGPGNDGKGKYDEIQMAFRAIKRDTTGWRVSLSGADSAGVISMSPEARSRGKETSLVKINSCENPPSATISDDGYTIKVSVDAGQAVIWDLDLDTEASVINFRPVLKGLAKKGE